MLYYFLAFSFFMAMCFLFRLIYRKTENYISFVVWILSSFLVVILLGLIVAENIKHPIKINNIYFLISAMVLASYLVPMIMQLKETKYIERISNEMEIMCGLSYLPLLKEAQKAYWLKWQPCFAKSRAHFEGEGELSKLKKYCHSNPYFIIIVYIISNPNLYKATEIDEVLCVLDYCIKHCKSDLLRLEYLSLSFTEKNDYDFIRNRNDFIGKCNRFYEWIEAHYG